MVKLTVYKVNAFTCAGEASSGNPAAVTLLDASAVGQMTDEKRQAMAAKINLSETAFVELVDPAAATLDAFKQQDTFKLRWFTPAAEVPLCGHATLASAYTVFKECGNPAAALHFQTLSGTLSVTCKQDGHQQLLQMSLPLSAAIDPLPAKLLPSTASSSGMSPVELLTDNSSLTALLWACLSTLPTAPAPAAASAAEASTCESSAEQAAWLAGVVEHVGYVAALKYLLVVLKPGHGRQGLEALKPNMTALQAAVGAEHMTGVIVTVPAEEGGSEGYDFYSRFYGPWAGIPEDPVTGSAHAVLAPYWSAVLGKQQLLARQCSERGGNVWMDVQQQPGRVIVSGTGAVVDVWTQEY